MPWNRKLDSGPSRPSADIPQGFSVELRSSDGAGLVRVTGRLDFAETTALWDQTMKLVLAHEAARIDFDLSGVTSADGGAMALLVHIRNRLEAQGVRSEFVGASPTVQTIVHLYEGDVHLPPPKRRRAESALAQIGRATIQVLLEAQLVMAFFGQMLISAIATVRAPRSANWKDLGPTMEHAGADAVPIVVLINFLVGFVMAFQGAVQLKQFGANIFVADLVGLSVTRELGPADDRDHRVRALGRGLRRRARVDEGLRGDRRAADDGLRADALPRAAAHLRADPGAADPHADRRSRRASSAASSSGLTTLDLTIAGYITETHKALKVWDVYSGVIKSVVFALAIALIACQQGLATTGRRRGGRAPDDRRPW